MPKKGQDPRARTTSATPSVSPTQINSPWLNDYRGYRSAGWDSKSARMLTTEGQKTGLLGGFIPTGLMQLPGSQRIAMSIPTLVGQESNISRPDAVRELMKGTATQVGIGVAANVVGVGATKAIKAGIRGARGVAFGLTKDINIHMSKTNILDKFLDASGKRANTGFMETPNAPLKPGNYVISTAADPRATRGSYSGAKPGKSYPDVADVVLNSQSVLAPNTFGIEAIDHASMRGMPSGLTGVLDKMFQKAFGNKEPMYYYITKGLRGVPDPEVATRNVNVLGKEFTLGPKQTNIELPWRVAPRQEIVDVVKFDPVTKVATRGNQVDAFFGSGGQTGPLRDVLNSAYKDAAERLAAERARKRAIIEAGLVGGSLVAGTSAGKRQNRK